MRPQLTMNAWLRYDAIMRGLRTAAPTSILEFGAGLGAFGAWLSQSYDYVGVEPDSESRRAAEQRIGSGGRGVVVAEVPPNREGSFDLACAFEVLEHIEDDVAALTEWRELLRPNGWLLASVPAHPHRYAAHDRIAGHVRRYSREELVSHLDDAGFDVVMLDCYGTGFGYVLEGARNVLAARREGHENFAVATAASARLYQPTAKWQTNLFAVVAMPFRIAQRPWDHSGKGIGWVVLARARV